MAPSAAPSHIHAFIPSICIALNPHFIVAAIAFFKFMLAE